VKNIPQEHFEDLPILAELREHLRELLAEAPARSGGRMDRWLRRRSRPLLSLALLALAGGSAAAAVSLSESASKPLVGSVPADGVKPSAHNEAGRRYRVTFVPQISGGAAGWTTFIDLPTPRASPGTPGGDGGEAGYPTSNMPLSGGFGVGFQSGPLSGGEVVDYVLTGPRVAAIRLGDEKIRSSTAGALPEGDRVAVFFRPANAPPIAIPPPGAHLPYRERVPVRSPRRPSRHTHSGGPRLSIDRPRTRLVSTTALQPLDGEGHLIPTTSPAQPPLGPSTRAWQVRTPGQSHPGAAADHPLPGACELGEHGLAGLTPQWGHVLAAIQPVADAEGELFLSCVDTEYFLHGWALDAAILIDARRPGQVLGAIPGAVAVADHPDVVNVALSGSPRGDLSARRIGDAWLVVQGGRDLDQRLEALGALRITKLSLAAVPVSATATLAARARACLQAHGLSVLANSSPSAYEAYGLSVADKDGRGALVEIYDSPEEAELHLHAAIDSARYGHAKVELHSSETITWAPRSSDTLAPLIYSCTSG
jgi:hypothetical protein